LDKQSRYIDEISLANVIQAILGLGASLPLQAGGCSMAPFIKDGDILTLSPSPRRKPGIGDVIACRLPKGNKLVIHRVIRVFKDRCLIRGDYCSEPDGWIPATHILAVVSSIDRDGNKTNHGIGPAKALIAFLSASNILYPLLCFLYRRMSGNRQRNPGYLSI
jgi:hypothetical protein